MKYKNSDYLTNISNEEDVIFLKSKLLPVNIRLMKSSGIYRGLILKQCEYIKFLALTTMDGYKKPHGMSAANAGLAFNIIGIVKNRGTKDEYCKILINPEIKEYLGNFIPVKTNFGSVVLDSPIEIYRYETVDVCYYDENGDIWRHLFSRQDGSLTIQHEIDHNNGILITDHL